MPQAGFQGREEDITGTLTHLGMKTPQRKREKKQILKHFRERERER